MAGTKNKLVNMFDIFAAQLERLSDDMEPEQLEQEVKRAEAMAKMSDPIIKIADLQYKAWETSLEYRTGGVAERLPKMLEVND